MNAFELIFIFLSFVTVFTLATVGGLFLFRRRSSAARIIRRYSFCLSVYLVIALLSSLLASRKELNNRWPVGPPSSCAGVFMIARSPIASDAFVDAVSVRPNASRPWDTGERGELW